MYFIILKSIYRLVHILKGKRNDATKDRNIIINKKLISIGKYTYGYEETSVLSWNENIKITIGRFCSVSRGLKLYCGGNHRTDWITTFPFGHALPYIINVNGVIGTPRTNGDIQIGNDVWIGRDVTILSGVTIGDGAVIAANSHVISNVDPYTIIGGNPAKQIKKRFSTEIIQQLLKIKWWDYPIEKIEKIVPFLCAQKDSSISENIKQIEIILGINSL